VSDEAASFVEPPVCCLRAVRRARPASDTIVVGARITGCLFVQLFKARRSRRRGRAARSRGFRADWRRRGGTLEVAAEAQRKLE
jgi:hypothetical protein